MKTTKRIWLTTLVRHSAWTAKKNPQFERAVQEAHLHGEKEVARVRAAGGLVFEPRQAHNVEYDVNYPPGTIGLIPNVLGKFSKRKFDGSEIYVPSAEELLKLRARFPESISA